MYVTLQDREEGREGERVPVCAEGQHTYTVSSNAYETFVAVAGLAAKSQGFAGAYFHSPPL